MDSEVKISYHGEYNGSMLPVLMMTTFGYMSFLFKADAKSRDVVIRRKVF